VIFDSVADAIRFGEEFERLNPGLKVKRKWRDKEATL
jgi:hypothetical protein